VGALLADLLESLRGGAAVAGGDEALRRADGAVGGEVARGRRLLVGHLHVSLGGELELARDAVAARRVGPAARRCEGLAGALHLAGALPQRPRLLVDAGGLPALGRLAVVARLGEELGRFAIALAGAID